jgi:phosphohistidine phosphatase
MDRVSHGAGGLSNPRAASDASRDMDLLVIRHAIAVERAEGTDDHARPLTAKGIKRMKAAVRGLDNLGLEMACVLHSPWQRAVETAELLEPVVRGRVADALVPTEHLTGSPRSELLAQIAEHGVRGSVAVVGHEPWLGELIALLTFGDSRVGESIPLKKGGVAWLEGTAAPGGMTLRALLPPRLLRIAGKSR